MNLDIKTLEKFLSPSIQFFGGRGGGLHKTERAVGTKFLKARSFYVHFSNKSRI
jgi:hypothetical protein